MAYTQIYKMPIKINGQWLNFNVLFNILMKIEEESRINSILPIKKRVSLLTSENRDIWNQGRNMLLKQGKGASINYIDKLGGGRCPSNVNNITYVSLFSI